MGLVWCPRDPKVRVNDQIIDLYLLIPLAYQDDFDTMKFTVTVPKGASTEVLYIEPDVDVEFVERSRSYDTGRKVDDYGAAGHERRGGGRVHQRNRQYVVDIDAHVTGVPDDAVAQLITVAPWDGTYQTKVGYAGGISDSVLLD